LAPVSEQGIEVCDVQAPEREQIEQDGDDFLNARRVAEPGANRSIMRAVAETGVHDLAA
jgi:hypothetical protein